MREFRTIVTFRTKIGDREHRTSLYSPEMPDEQQAEDFGATLVAAGTAIAYRVISRERPVYRGVLDQLDGSWYNTGRVKYLSEADAALPIYRAGEQPTATRT